MCKVDVTIGYKEIITEKEIKYFGGETNNGMCYKDLDAWKNKKGVIYIPEYGLTDNGKVDIDDCWYSQEWMNFVKETIENYDIYDENFSKHMAEIILQECDWQDLSTKLQELDIEEEYGYFMADYLIQYVDNNLNTCVYDIFYTNSQMNMNHTDLETENPNLYEHLSNLVEDFVIDNNLYEGWSEDVGVDIKYIFDKLIIKNK
jgi:hypothetical protein